jgi:hypothetical protein
MYPKEVNTIWSEENGLLTTRLSGLVDIDDIEDWKAGLMGALQLLKPDSSFKAFINIHGFKAVNMDAHKAFRTVVPLILAEHNFRIGYVDLFDNVELPLTSKDGIQCIAVAHAHHDADKMNLYESSYSKANDRYFTDPAEAEKWLLSVAP